MTSKRDLYNEAIARGLEVTSRMSRSDLEDLLDATPPVDDEPSAATVSSPASDVPDADPIPVIDDNPDVVLADLHTNRGA